jgi:hypothetical protein
MTPGATGAVAAREVDEAMIKRLIGIGEESLAGTPMQKRDSLIDCVPVGLPEAGSEEFAPVVYHHTNTSTPYAAQPFPAPHPPRLRLKSGGHRWRLRHRRALAEFFLPNGPGAVSSACSYGASSAPSHSSSRAPLRAATTASSSNTPWSPAACPVPLCRLLRC